MPAKKRITERTRTGPPADLTGRRYGKWTVLEYAGDKVRYYGGHRLFTRMWLCRCDCGVQKQVIHHNLTKGQSKQCQQCCRTRHDISSKKLYRAWGSRKKGGNLPTEWRDFDAFRQAVGDAPDNRVDDKQVGDVAEELPFPVVEHPRCHGHPQIQPPPSIQKEKNAQNSIQIG
jgi:hypothetical protein